jgi:hypothetical protein
MSEHHRPADDERADDNLGAVIEHLIEIWRHVLGMDGVAADSHLLELGATSLTAVRIRTRIRAELRRDVDLIDFLEHPTPRELAAIVAVAPPWQGVEPWYQLDWSPESEPSAGDSGPEVSRGL